MKSTSLIAPLLGVLLSTGCSHFYTPYSTKPDITDADAIRLEKKYANHELIIANVEANATNEAQCRARNEVLTDELEICDFKYAKFRNNVYTRDAAGNTFADLSSLGLSGAATLVGGGTGQILSGADTALKGAQKAVSERWLASKTIPVIISKMDSDRAAVLTILTSNMAKAYSTFSMREGFKSIQDYNSKGALVSAIAGLQSDTSADQKKNETNLKAAQSNPKPFTPTGK